MDLLAIDLTGISAFESYSGFALQKQSGDIIIPSGEYSTVSGDIVVGAGETFTLSSDSTVNVGTLESISITSHFSLPKGQIVDRPEDPKEGMVRFNIDLNTLKK